MRVVNLLAVFVENKPGQTARIAGLLAEAGINLSWLTIANSGSFGVMRFLVDQRDTAVRALKDKGVMVSLVEALAVGCPVLGWDHGGVGELLATLQPSGAVPPGDMPALLARAQALLAAPPRPPSHIPHTLAAMQQGTLDLYEQLINTGR